MTNPISPRSPTWQQEILERAFPIKGDAGSQNHPNMNTSGNGVAEDSAVVQKIVFFMKEDQCLLVLFIPSTVVCHVSNQVLRFANVFLHKRWQTWKFCGKKMHKAFHIFLKKVIVYKVLPIKRKIIHCMSMSRCHLKYEIIGA